MWEAEKQNGRKTGDQPCHVRSPHADTIDLKDSLEPLAKEEFIVYGAPLDPRISSPASLGTWPAIAGTVEVITVGFVDFARGGLGVNGKYPLDGDEALLIAPWFDDGYMHSDESTLGACSDSGEAGPNPRFIAWGAVGGSTLRVIGKANSLSWAGV